MTSLAIPSSCRTKGPEETFAVAVHFAEQLEPGSVVLLQGPLGAGKTHFTRGVCSGLGMKDLWEVDSPTYTVVNHYDAGPGVDHIDLYRLQDPRELDEIGFDEMLASATIKLIEWPERLGNYPLPKDTRLVSIKICHEEREIRFSGTGDLG